MPSWQQEFDRQIEASYGLTTLRSLTIMGRTFTLP